MHMHACCYFYALQHLIIIQTLLILLKLLMLKPIITVTWSRSPENQTVVCDPTHGLFLFVLSCHHSTATSFAQLHDHQDGVHVARCVVCPPAENLLPHPRVVWSTIKSLQGTVWWLAGIPWELYVYVSACVSASSVCVCVCMWGGGDVSHLKTPG